MLLKTNFKIRAILIVSFDLCQPTGSNMTQILQIENANVEIQRLQHARNRLLNLTGAFHYAKILS